LDEITELPADPQFSVPLPEPEPPTPPPSRSIAPIWHTAILIAIILGYSFLGARSGPISDRVPLLAHYGASALLEIALVLWALWGLRLYKNPLRTILGAVPRSPRAIAIDIGTAAIFWLVAMCVLATVGITWVAVENRIYQIELRHQQQQPHPPGQPAPAPTPNPQDKQLENARNLMRLAPSTFAEGFAWGVLCLLVGFAEELVFRGYLMAQGIAWLRTLPFGILFSALIFGSAHGYEGARGMVTIGVYGALFSILALYRRSLVPGMIAHAWHDFATGILLALIRNYHLLDKIQNLPKQHS